MKFRFTIRAILVAMALLAMWCAYSMNWIRQRRAAIDSGIAHRGTASYLPTPSAPGMLWMFGEQGYELIAVDESPSIDIDEIKGLFPEAEISLIGYF